MRSQAVGTLFRTRSAPQHSKAQDAILVALSRRKQGFESPRERQSNQTLDRSWPSSVPCFSNFSPSAIASFRCDQIGEHQTTNLGVRSSNLFGRANNSLILIQKFCAIFSVLTTLSAGQHQGNTGLDFFPWQTLRLQPFGMTSSKSANECSVVSRRKPGRQQAARTVPQSSSKFGNAPVIGSADPSFFGRSVHLDPVDAIRCPVLTCRKRAPDLIYVDCPNAAAQRFAPKAPP
jgi:hypothetical protein